MAAMFFRLADIEWIACIVAILIGCVLLVRATWRKRLWIRITAWLGALSFGGIASLFFLFFCLGLLDGCNTHGKPIYSPNRQEAAMVWTYDAGATGGGTWVELYDMHGLRFGSVFDGQWESVNQDDVRWADDSHLTIDYDHSHYYDEQKSCKDFHAVKVTCVPK